jgi:hypothetical protein
MRFTFESLEKFIVEMTTQNTLNIGGYRNRIPWDNLPERGLYRILGGDNKDLDSSLILITQPGEAFVIKDWLENGGDWAEDWFSGEPFTDLEKFLKDNRAFNIVEMNILNPKKPPMWDNVTMERKDGQ